MITEEQIQKSLAETRVKETGWHLKLCAFCEDGAFIGKPCVCCNGIGLIDHLDMFMLGVEARIRYEAKVLNAFFGEG